MANSVKWCLKLKFEDLKISPMSLARTLMTTRAFSVAAEAAAQRRREEMETVSADYLFQETWL